MSKTIPVFCYGSNNPEQLTQRLGHRPEMAGAYLEDYRRSFVGHSQKWNGGVCSLEKAFGKTVYGLVAYLTAADIKQLDRFEGWRADDSGATVKRKLKVTTQQGQELTALVYLGTATERKAPSQAYREAIAKTISAFWSGSDGSAVTWQDISYKRNPNPRAKALYHVTFTENVPTIRAKGILPMQTSNWIKAGDSSRYGSGEIYAFENELDAHRWAAKMGWEFFKDYTSGGISVVKFKSSAGWEVDDNDPLSQAASHGRWLKKIGSVSPKDIIGSTAITSATWKRPGFDNRPNPDGDAYIRLLKRQASLGDVRALQRLRRELTRRGHQDRINWRRENPAARTLTFKDAADAMPFAQAISKRQKSDLNQVMKQLGDLYLEGSSWEEAAMSLGYRPRCVSAKPGDIIEDPLGRWPGHKFKVPEFVYRGGKGVGASVLVVALTEAEAQQFGEVTKFRFLGGRVAIDWGDLVTWYNTEEYSVNEGACQGLGCDLILPSPEKANKLGFNYQEHAVVCNPKCLEWASD